MNLNNNNNKIPLVTLPMTIKHIKKLSTESDENKKKFNKTVPITTITSNKRKINKIKNVSNDIEDRIYTKATKVIPFKNSKRLTHIILYSIVHTKILKKNFKKTFFKKITSLTPNNCRLTRFRLICPLQITITY